MQSSNNGLGTLSDANSEILGLSEIKSTAESLRC
jgi:hypothetical protein